MERAEAIRYIRKATANGLDLDEITRRLQLNGWEKAEIQMAHAYLLSLESKAKQS